MTDVICAPAIPGSPRSRDVFPPTSANPRAVAGRREREAVDLTVVGPELPLSLGVVDLFAARRASDRRSDEGRRGARMEQGVREGLHGAAPRADGALPRLRFRERGARRRSRRGEFGYPVVFKADGLAAGKGVVIAEDRATADDAVRAAMVDRRFGAAGERIVLEEFLVGEEASYFVLADGTAFVPLSSAQDHKRIFDDDRGPNTGGMGAFAPSPLHDGRRRAARARRDRPAGARGHGARGPSVSRIPVRRA